MSGEVEGRSADPTRLRLSDADRHRAGEFLREAAGEGRLDLEELEERLSASWAAKVRADLVPLVVDLPGHELVLGSEPAPVPVGRTPAPPTTGFTSSLAVMSEQRRQGPWRVEATHQALAVMGSVVLDLREATFSAPETVVTTLALMGAVEIVVDARTRVSVEGLGVMGGFTQNRDRVEADLSDTSPLVRVRGLALMGAVTVVRKAQPGGAGTLRRLRGR